MPKSVKNDISGKRFGRLTVISFLPDDSPYSRFLCKCDCGTEKSITAQSMINGSVVSCGCYNKEILHNRGTHWQSGNKTRSGSYSSWANMMMRCEWGGHPSYDYYGAKGIRVCKEWQDFKKFLEDMGDRPKETSIDRIDNSLGYFKENCRWATRRQQSLNTSRTIKVLIKGKIEVLQEFCEKSGISKKAIRARASRRGNDYVAALRSVGIECDYCNG